MIWIGALVQSGVLTLVLIGLLIGITHWTDYSRTVPEGYVKICIGMTSLVVVSWIIFGWVLAVA